MTSQNMVKMVQTNDGVSDRVAYRVAYQNPIRVEIAL